MKVSKFTTTIGLVLLALALVCKTHRESAQRHHRMLLFSQGTRTVTIDFYRTFEEKQVLFIKWKSYSISKLYCFIQIQWSNVWFDGRLKFVLGDVYDYVGPHTGASIFSLRSDFELYQARDPRRISVLCVKRTQAQTHNGIAGGLGVPLGASPLLVVGARDKVTGVPVLFFGILLSHEIGHLIGFGHTSYLSGGEFVQQYSECGLDLRYPKFKGDDPSDNHLFDVVRNTTYHHNDWSGRSNVMSQMQPLNLLSNIFGVGIYKYNYGPIFDQITECWVSKAE